MDPFVFSRRTERPDRTGANKVLFDGDGHHCRWGKWTLITITDQHAATAAAAIVSLHVQKVIARTDLAGEPKILDLSLIHI